MIGRVEVSGVNAADLPVLTNQEMRRLFERARRGDRAAREQLVRGNLRLVMSVLQRFRNRAEQFDDLFQVGCIGLIKAVDNFDLAQDVCFSTYAVPTVIGEIRRYLRDDNPLRVSRSLRDLGYRALRAHDALAQASGREPFTVEIAAALDAPVEDVMAALGALQEPVSLFEPVYDEGGDPILLLDHVRDEARTEGRWADAVALREALSRLDARERAIVQARFFAGQTQMEVAGELGISQAQVSRLEKAALLRLRRYL